jgi:hypothetical protein
VRDNEESRLLSPDSVDLIDCEDFVRRNVKNRLESAASNENHIAEQRLSKQIPDVIDHAISRAFLDYRAMVNANRSTEPSVDSGYASNRPGVVSSSWGRKRKRSARGLAPETSILSTPDPEEVLGPPEVLSPLLWRTDPISSFHNTTSVQHNLASMSPAEYLPFQGNIPDEFFAEELFLSNSTLLSDQIGAPISHLMDPDPFNWSLPPQEGSGSNHPI